MNPIGLGLGLEETHVLITGAGGHIGSVTVAAFLCAGAHVTAIDISQDKLIALKTSFEDDSKHWGSRRGKLHIVDGDVRDGRVLEYMNYLGPGGEWRAVSCCVTFAALDLSVLPPVASLSELPLDEWQRTFDVNVKGTFLTAKAWMERLRTLFPGHANTSLILVGSESGSFGERHRADYAASKSAIQGGLLQSLKADAPHVYPGARVNAIAPGPVDTASFRSECEDDPELYYAEAQSTVGLGEPVSVECVARTILYLASDNYSYNVHGQVISVDSGKQGKLQWTKHEGEALRDDPVDYCLHGAAPPLPR